MSKSKLIIIGLGSGSADDVSVGTLKKLRELTLSGTPLLLRTSHHPCVSTLIDEGIVFTESFDSVYDIAETFENVYATIAETVAKAASEYGIVGYLVPGHPLLGEQTVKLLLQKQTEFEIDLIPGSSFIEACLSAARQEVTQLLVLDALSLPDLTNNFRKFRSPFNVSMPHLIYQVYDTSIASRVKLALLEDYPAEFEVMVITRAGQPGSEKVSTTPLYKLDHFENSFDYLTTLFVPTHSPAPSSDFVGLLDIMAQLRNPDTGCPWDREQSPESLKRYVVEEAYEVLDAIDDGIDDKYVEELGDLLLQVVFHAQLAREREDFTIEDVIAGISDKLLRRHPHVFGDLSVAGSDEVLTNWEIIKRAEKGNQDRKSRLDGVPRHLPALAQALDVSKRAAKAGFEWDSIDGIFLKLEEELVELKDALQHGDRSQVSSELGDLLFTVVNIGRFVKIDAEDSLRVMVKRFAERFRLMEAASSLPLEELDSAAYERLWQDAKREQTKE